jgi:hypothetical protein
MQPNQAILLLFLFLCLIGSLPSLTRKKKKTYIKYYRKAEKEGVDKLDFSDKYSVSEN